MLPSIQYVAALNSGTGIRGNRWSTKVYATRENGSRCATLCRGTNGTVRAADLVRSIAIDIVRMQITVITLMLLGMINGDHGTMSPIATIVLGRFEDGGSSVSALDHRPESRIPLQTAYLDRASCDDQRTHRASPAPTPQPALGYSR